MPEYPDIIVYVERLRAFTAGRVLAGVRIGNPFVLRTAVPPLDTVAGRTIREVRHLGKRLIFSLTGDDELYIVIHLMIAGRLRWKAKSASHRGRDVVAVFDFDEGALVFTEASPKKRASIHVVQGAEGLAAFDRGGLDVLEVDEAAFAERLRLRRHTLKRALTDPTLFSGIGNAYSDEILFRARLSPVKLTTSLFDEEVAALYAACRSELTLWADKLRAEVGAGFPDKVTAFREDMAMHGKFRKPCPDCGNPVQRIVHAENESNYCAHCQTGGRLLADRALSQLLKSDWPRTLEELEERKAR